MSTRVIRSMNDFARHRMGVEVVCKCGHRALLDTDKVLAKFKAKGWYTGLGDGYSMGAPHSRFRCTRCNKKEVVRVGPGER